MTHGTSDPEVDEYMLAWEEWDGNEDEAAWERASADGLGDAWEG
ncbi:hypothetical protein [Spiractinospora alimapuensis]|nr:hypothetical protein [Spiractinospora alimapuensis]